MFNHLCLKCDSLVSSVMQNQAEKAIDLLETGRLDIRFLDDIGHCKNPLPCINYLCVMRFYWIMIIGQKVFFLLLNGIGKDVKLF